MKLATQLTVTAMAVAIGRAEELKSSVTRNQGIDPGPVAKKITKTIIKRILQYDNHAAESWYLIKN